MPRQEILVLLAIQNSKFHFFQYILHFVGKVFLAILCRARFFFIALNIRWKNGGGTLYALTVHSSFIIMVHALSILHMFTTEMLML